LAAEQWRRAKKAWRSNRGWLALGTAGLGYLSMACYDFFVAKYSPYLSAGDLVPLVQMIAAADIFFAAVFGPGLTYSGLSVVMPNLIRQNGEHLFIQPDKITYRLFYISAATASVGSVSIALNVDRQHSVAWLLSGLLVAIVLLPVLAVFRKQTRATILQSTPAAAAAVFGWITGMGIVGYLIFLSIWSENAGSVGQLSAYIFIVLTAFANLIVVELSEKEKSKAALLSFVMIYGFLFVTDPRLIFGAAYRLTHYGDVPATLTTRAAFTEFPAIAKRCYLSSPAALTYRIHLVNRLGPDLCWRGVKVNPPPPG